MNVHDKGDGAVIEMSDEEVYRLRASIRRLLGLYTNIDEREVILPTPQEARAASALLDELTKIPVFLEYYESHKEKGYGQVAERIRRKTDA